MWPPMCQYLLNLWYKCWLTPCKPEEPGMACATKSSIDWGCEPNICGSKVVGPPPVPGPLSLRESPSAGCSKSCDSKISFVSVISSSISCGSSLTPGSSKITYQKRNTLNIHICWQLKANTNKYMLWNQSSFQTTNIFCWAGQYTVYNVGLIRQHYCPSIHWC